MSIGVSLTARVSIDVSVIIVGCTYEVHWDGLEG